MQHELNKPNTNTIMFYPFLYFKNPHGLKKKIKFVSKEDTSLFFFFLIKKMVGFASNEDTNQFLLGKIQIYI